VIINLTNKKPFETIFFIDEAKKNLIICFCTISRGYDYLEEVSFSIVFSTTTNNEKNQPSVLDSFPLSIYKEGLLSKPETNVYINKKYKIPKNCDSVKISVNSKKEFEMDCTIIIR
jgi:hypothetical protein